MRRGAREILLDKGLLEAVPCKCRPCLGNSSANYQNRSRLSYRKARHESSTCGSEVNPSLEQPSPALCVRQGETLDYIMIIFFPAFF